MSKLLVQKSPKRCLGKPSEGNSNSLLLGGWNEREKHVYNEGILNTLSDGTVRKFLFFCIEAVNYVGFETVDICFYLY